MISFNSKEHRLPYLEKSDFEWEVVVHELPKPTVTATITEANQEKP